VKEFGIDSARNFERMNQEFYNKTALDGAKLLLGKLLCRKENGIVTKARITETECYMGEEDKGCHANRGKTQRNEIMYQRGGFSYIYLIYGMYNLLNIVFGEEGSPEAALIRGIEGYNGPGKLTKALNITRGLNRINLLTSEELWIEDDGFTADYIAKPRVGIDYAGDYWKNINWRFLTE
jgi:DNA-3-methyladenine glycosylase